MSDDFVVELKTRLETLAETYSREFDGKLEFNNKPLSVKLVSPIRLVRIASFFDEVFGDGHGLPELDLKGASLDRVSISQADARRHRPAFAEIGLAFKSGTWTLFDGFEISLKSVFVSWWGGDWSAQIIGSVKIHGKVFTISLDWPSLVVRGHLETGQSDNIKSLVQSHGLAVARKAAPTLSMLEIFVAGHAHYVEINLAVEDLLQFGPLKLNHCDARLIYSGGLRSGYGGRLHSVITLGSVKFDLVAEKTGEGWSGSAMAEATGDLETLVRSLSKEIHGRSLSLTAHGVPRTLATKNIEGSVELFVAPASNHVRLEASVRVDKDSVAHFSIDIAKGSLTIRADLVLEGLTFEAVFSKRAKESFLIGQFASEAGVSLSLKQLARLTSVEGQFPLDEIGDAISVTVRNMLLAWGSDGSESRLLLAAEIEGGADLSGLGDIPVIGDLLPTDSRASLTLSPVIASKEWAATSIKALNRLRGENGLALPPKVQEGPSLNVALQLPDGGEPVDMQLSIDTQPESGTSPTVSVPPDTPAKSGVKWVDVGKNLGPVNLERVGLELLKKEKAIRVLMDGGVSIAGLSVSLIGLGGTYGLDDQSISFELNGLGLDFKKGELEFKGAFGNIGGDYVGKVLLKAKTVSLSASGGFAMIDDMPSMFLYGVLNTPLGGPPFFFVEGLAAGIGFNRALVPPEVSQVREFPLVVDAVKAAGGKVRKQQSMAKELERLHAFVTPELGQYFLAVGVKFTSFKLLDSFLLLVLSAGNRLRLDLIGTSTYQTPPIVPDGVPAMARIDINIVGSLTPESGTIKVRGQIGPNSYVYSSLCKLSGGFAFYSWFDGPHAGDFVLSVGGYHKAFKRPSHYPPVKRISVTYQITDDIYVKGTGYFALVPSMFMAGAAIEAHAEIGAASASFRASIDFMVAWEPYHYDVSIEVDIKAKWKCFHTTAHAELHIWGPPFSGHAEVSWTAFTFDVDFGGDPTGPVPITWAKFKESFLPERLESSFAVRGGLIANYAQKPKGGKTIDLPVINAKELALVVDSVFPVSKASGKIVTKTNSMGCGAVGAATIRKSDIKFKVDRLSRKKPGGRLSAANVSSQFKMEIFKKSFPSAMWGGKLQPDLDDKPVVACGGFSLVPAAEAGRSSPSPVFRKDVGFSPKVTEATNRIRQVRFRRGSAKTGNIGERMDQSKAALAPKRGTQQARNREVLFAALGLPASNGGRALVDTMTDIPDVVASTVGRGSR